MENKRIKLTNCTSKLHLVKAVADVTKKSLSESKNIVDLIVMPIGDGTLRYKYGTLLLNESSITPEQWEEITQHFSFKDAEVEFEYV